MAPRATSHPEAAGSGSVNRQEQPPSDDGEAGPPSVVASSGDTQTLRVPQVDPALQLLAPHTPSTTSTSNCDGSASGGRPPAQLILPMQYERSWHSRPVWQSALVMHERGRQWGPPWHVEGSDPARQLSGGGLTTSAKARP